MLSLSIIHISQNLDALEKDIEGVMRRNWVKDRRVLWNYVYPMKLNKQVWIGV